MRPPARPLLPARPFLTAPLPSGPAPASAPNTALLLALVSPVLAGFVLLGLVLLRVALGPLPRALGEVVLLPGLGALASGLVALARAPSGQRPRALLAVALAGALTLGFGLRTRQQALSWACAAPAPGPAPRPASS